ncbi:ead/Ea22-like family protein [Raoultella planticola]
MTDITELAQSLKAAAEKAGIEQWVNNRGEVNTADYEVDGGVYIDHICDCEIIGTESPQAEFIAMANPANILALVEALEKAQAKIIELQQGCENDPRTHEIIDLQERIAELESRSVTVKLPPTIWYEHDDYAQEIAVLEKSRVLQALIDAGIKVEADSVDADVSDRNKPGMVVAVHIDAGDFVKVKGQVYEVEETDFDDHDVTLWFVGGETLKCAAGCQIEVVSAPEEAE